jgi:predicted O-linked N-acetylglucosamine transferase (SPINDLY family)
MLTPPNIHFSKKDLGLPKDGFVFCCFNNTYKITPNIFDSWARILNQVDKSVLMIYADNDLSQKNLIKEIAGRGINPKKLIFGDSLPRPKYLARYRVADLFLDTAPYNAGTTASDALRMGLPVLTLKGKAFPSRMASSILNSVNLPELITHSQKDYESLAIELANCPDKIKKIKDKLLANLNTAPLYNSELFTKNLESAYQMMYERHRQGLKPEHIIIEH